MKLSRLRTLVRAGWRQMLRSLEDPPRLPVIARRVALDRAHLLETLNAQRFAGWLRARGIDTIIDVGAHRGEFASGILGVLPGAAIHSFEPQPGPYAALAARLQSNPRARTYNIALGSQPGEATFHCSSFTKSSSLLPMAELHREVSPYAVDASDIRVRVDVLDTVVELGGRETVLLKLDVQGYEVEVLRGAERTLRHCSVVLVETSVGGTLYDGEATFADVYELLTQAGFTFSGVWDQLSDPRDGAPLQIDAIFSRRGSP